MQADVDLEVRCDKPYDLDAADKRRGKPRRRRKDSRSTAYELTIRLNERQREVLDGKRKFVRVAYAVNKKEDLAKQIAAFENDVSRKIEAAACAKGYPVDGQRVTVERLVLAYLKSREPVTVSEYARDSRNLLERYIGPTIGRIPFDDLEPPDIQKALDSIPELSHKLNEKKRAREADHRAEVARLHEAGAITCAPSYPEFKPVRVAGMPTKHKVLSLLREAGNYGMDMGLVRANPAASKRLAKSYPKSKPRIDNWTEDEAKLIHTGIASLPLSSKKIEFQLLMMCGLRPCEVLSLTFDDITIRDGGGWLHVVKRTKTSNGYRTIPLDPETSALLAEWKESRLRVARDNGLVFSGSWLVCCEDGQKTVSNTLVSRWRRFLKGMGIEHRRPYSLRHTFATMNARLNVDAKTLSGLMGHASAGFTYQVYAGYLESAALPVTSNYLGFLEEGEETKE